MYPFHARNHFQNKRFIKLYIPLKRYKTNFFPRDKQYKSKKLLQLSFQTTSHKSIGRNQKHLMSRSRDYKG